MLMRVKARLKILSLIFACLLVTYIGSYTFLSVNGQYQPGYYSLTGIHNYMWAPEGLISKIPFYKLSPVQQWWHGGLGILYWPLVCSDWKWWHPFLRPGEKTNYRFDEAASQETTLWIARVYRNPPTDSYWNYKKFIKDRKEAVNRLSEHPKEISGTILYGHDGMYVVQTAEGQCYLVTNHSYAAKQTISLTVYPAGHAPLGEENGPCYSDDPDLAYSSCYINP